MHNILRHKKDSLARRGPWKSLQISQRRRAAFAQTGDNRPTPPIRVTISTITVYERFQQRPPGVLQGLPGTGRQFIDVGCIFDNPEHWRLAVDTLHAKTDELHFDFILAMDARGFMIAGALALEHKVGFAMARKAGKLPGKAISIDYQREYGSATIEIQPERIKGQRVLIVDDVLATGGTIEAAASLLRQLGKEVVGAAALFDIAFFRDKRVLTMPVVTLRDV